jgi:hypothetical protein
VPAGAVYVGRPTKWGNPFRIGDTCADVVNLDVPIDDDGPLVRSGVVEDATHAVALYRFWLDAKVPFTSAEIQAELRGRDLACWCPPGQSCHADVLLDLANRGPTSVMPIR